MAPAGWPLGLYFSVLQPLMSLWLRVLRHVSGRHVAAVLRTVQE